MSIPDVTVDAQLQTPTKRDHRSEIADKDAVDAVIALDSATCITDFIWLSLPVRFPSSSHLLPIFFPCFYRLLPVLYPCLVATLQSGGTKQ